jgi:hypothetical protein
VGEYNLKSNLTKVVLPAPLGPTSATFSPGLIIKFISSKTLRDSLKLKVKFSNFINRIRSNFKELIVKPLKLQMCMEFPELKDDEIFLNQVDISFNSNQIFEEWKKLANMEKRSSILSTLLGIQTADGLPYFHIEYLIDKVMKLTPEEKEENKAYWIKAKGSGTAQPGAEGGGEFGGGGEAGGEFGAEPGAPGEFGGAEPGEAGGEFGGSEPGGTPPAEGGGTPPPAEGGEGGEFEF